MPDLLTDLARVRELMAANPAQGPVPMIEFGDAALTFLRAHASGIEAMARDAERWRTYRDGSDPLNDALRIECRDLYDDELDAAIDAMKEAGRE